MRRSGPSAQADRGAARARAGRHYPYPPHSRERKLTPTPDNPISVAAAFLRLLASRGIDYLFANSGTDFASIVEAYATLGTDGVPVPVTVPHENVAIHMAMGHWLVSQRMQAVMVHVNVGTANSICGLLNAARCHVPVLFAAGRTPLTEKGAVGSRNIHIHWTQEMFDQAGMVREAAKWDYELRSESHLPTVVDRAIGIANSVPRGPVYLTLPREVLARAGIEAAHLTPSRHGVASSPGPSAQAVREAADLFRRAKAPVIVTTGIAFEPEAASALARFAEVHGVPVVQYAARCSNLPTAHPLHAGFDPVPWIAESDLVLVLDSVVPWIPGQVDLANTKVIQVGADPIHSEIPLRGFECDLALTSSPAEALDAIGRQLIAYCDEQAGSIRARKQKVAAQRHHAAARMRAQVEEVKDQVPIHPAWIGHCINEAKDDRTILIKECPQLSLAQLDAQDPISVLAPAAAGGLGWGLGVALGAKMAAPDRLVIAVEGDGAYMFCEPVSAHYVGMEQKLPFLTIIVNNRRWNEVRAATLHVHPEGAASKQGAFEPLVNFEASLRLHKVVEAAGGHGERVTDPRELPAALERAISMVRVEKRQVVLEIVSA